MKTKVSHPLFDTLIAENQTVRNDADLCRELGVQAPTFSKMRHGKLEISDTLRVAVMRRFRWSLRRLDDLAPPGSATSGAPANNESH